MSTIKKIIAREMFDSRADITLEVDVILDDGSIGRSMIPTGTSVGKHEVVELRDNDSRRFGGKGLLKAINAVTEIIQPALLGKCALEQTEIDRLLLELDGTSDKSRLGANSILGVSMAVAKAAASHQGVSLCRYLGGSVGREIPSPILTMLCGGRHGGGNLDFQDFQIIPLCATRLIESLAIGRKIHAVLKGILQRQGLPVGVSGTGGFMPPLKSNEAALRMLVEAIEQAGYRPGIDVALSMDVAAEMFHQDGRYVLHSEGRILTSDEFIDLLDDLVNRYPIVLIEDALGEDDFQGWQKLTRRLGDRIELVGDDLFSTHIGRFNHGLSLGLANSILVKPNQIGTLSETLDIVATAKTCGYGVVISRRSGETEDCAIADIAIATNCGKVKFGSFARTEGLSKYNQLLRLEEQLGKLAVFRGKDTLKSDLGRLATLFRPAPAGTVQRSDDMLVG